MAHQNTPWYESAPLPASLREQIAERYRLFAGVRMDADDGGGDGGGDGGDDAGDGGDDGADGGDDGGLDLSAVTLDQLKEHPEFQAELNRVVKDRVKKAEASAREKAKREAEAAGQSADERAAAEMQTLRDDLTGRDERISALTRELLTAKAAQAAVDAGGNPKRLAQIARLADLADAVDEDGNIDSGSIKAAVARVKREAPELFSTGDGGSGLPDNSGGELSGEGDKGTAFTRTQLEKMSQEEMTRRWDEIQKAQEEGRVDMTR